MAPKRNQAAQNAFERRFTVDAAVAAGETVLPAGGQVLSAGSPPAYDAAQTLRLLAVHSNGWLRIVSHDEGATVYYKFKWSKGPHAGGYVMWLSADMDASTALDGLLRKVRAVEAYEMRATPDHPYE